MTKYTYFVLVWLVMACSPDKQNPQQIIDQAIEVAGGKNFSASLIEFDFRDRHYIAKRKGGEYSYERIFIDSISTIRDVVSNDGFFREVNREHILLPDTTAGKYQRSTNSVIYFALLPFGLNDNAVKKRFVEETEIDGERYSKIEVTFTQEEGGDDHDDVFLYWIHQHKHTIDFLAYQFHTDGGGVRFRKAIKQHFVNGITLQDYINYKPKNSTTPLDSLESLYKLQLLTELSRIELKNISVNLLR